MTVKLRKGWICFVCYGAALSAGWAELDTFLIPVRKPGGNDGPAYVSSVGQRAAIRGNIVYVADGSAGLRVYELSAARGARMLGAYSTGESALSIRLDGACASVWDSSNGVVAFDINFPAKLRRVSTPDVTANRPAGALWTGKQTSDDTASVVAAIVEGQLLIARDDLGVVSIDLQCPPYRQPKGTLPVVDLAQTSPAATQVSGMKRVPLTENEPVPPVSSAGIGSRLAAKPETLAASAHLAMPLQLSVTVDGEGLRIQVSGPGGSVVRVQRTQNLFDGWDDWTTAVLDDNPTELVDPEGETMGQVFYRAVTP